MGETVFMIHGGFARGACFDKLAAVFAEHGHRCLAPDLPYHNGASDGEVDPRLADCGVRDYVDALAATLTAMDEPPVLLGHSMGGLLAQMLAARGLAKALILLAPAAPWGIYPSTLYELRGSLGLLTTPGAWSRALTPTYDIAEQTTFHLLPPHERAEAYAFLVPESGKALFEILFWMLDPARATAVAPDSVRCPVLTIAASEDRVTPPATVRQVASRYRHAGDYREYPDNAHWLIREPGYERIGADCAAWIAHVLDGNRL